MNKDSILTSVVVGGVFLLSLSFVIYATKHDEQQNAFAKQLAYEKWSQNDLFINTFERYNDIYHRLSQQRDKEALALAYVKMIIRDLFLFPSKNHDNAILNVLLPAAKEGDINKPFVLQQIHIGSDNGIHDALKYLIDGRERHLYEPPSFMPFEAQLMEYIKTGNRSALRTVSRDVISAIAVVDDGTRDTEQQSNMLGGL